VDPQLSAVIGDLRAAEERLWTLHAALSGDAWTRRPASTRWSPAECLAHLNLTSAALLPLVRAGLHQAGEGRRRASKYRRDLVGWLIWKVVAPSGGVRTRTVRAFTPAVDRSPESLLAEFGRLQADVIACVRAADGLPIDDVKLVSPFDARLRYNLYAALTMVPRHQHRHLLQAERAAGVALPDASAIAV
jgi:hypothetical protein